VDALGELLGLSRTRMSARDLAATGELLDRVAQRRRLSLDHTVVALAGATGSGKSTLFNTLTGLELSEAGVRRPTTCAPVACAWDPDGAAGLLDRLGVERHLRHARQGRTEGFGASRRAGGAGGPGHPGVPDGPDGLRGLILLDLPDHDSAASGHRDQVDRLLALVDAVVWVLDPEKYADAALHERYLRPLAGHADVTLVVLNQVDRLPEEAAEQVLDDLRRLLDEDGLALGEHGEAGAVVLAASALTGEGVPEVRAAIRRIVAERGAANRRLAADLDRTTACLRPLYVADWAGGPIGLTDRSREDFTDRLAEAVDAAAAGAAAERDWARAAVEACGTPWKRLLGAPRARRDVGRAGTAGAKGERPDAVGSAGYAGPATPDAPAAPATSRPVVEEAVRTVAAVAARGLPVPWARAVREAARRGGAGLAEALDAAAVRAAPREPERPRWWSAVSAAQWLLLAVAVAGAVGAAVVAAGGPGVPWWPPVTLLALGGLGGPVLAWAGWIAARGPARRYGQAAERRLRHAAAECGREMVLEPVAAELLRYREVREQYGVVAGGAAAFGTTFG
jgi:putative protein kinase ArgK-like GTPase of G3E family